MSSIVVQDLAHSAALDQRAMTSMRGGTGIAKDAGKFLGKDVNININVNQQIGQFQQIGINVLNNNGVIGAPIGGPDIKVPAHLWAENHATF